MKTHMVTTYLEQLALSPLETKIYLTLLQEGSLDVHEIITKLNIHRTSVYPPLESLFDKGLIFKSVKGKHTNFIVNDPDKSLRTLLDETIERKKQELNEIQKTFPNFLKQLPLTSTKRNATAEAETKFYKGKAGVKKIYEEVLQAKEQRSFFHLESIANVFPENFQLFDQAFTANPKMKMFEIIDYIPEQKEYLDSITHNKNYFCKFLPKGVTLTAQDTLIYDDKVAIIYLKNETSGIVLHNRDLFNNFKTIFDALWNLLPEVKR